MFVINEDNSIYVTRGDILFFSVSAKDGEDIYHFVPGDVLRIKVYDKKGCESVVLQKDFPVLSNAEQVEIYLTEEDTKIGEIINKPKDYWYEVELNPDGEPQTIIGYNEEGPALFKLFPKGEDIDVYVPDEEDIPFVDEELDLTSPRPVANRVIAAKLAKMGRDIDNLLPIEGTEIINNGDDTYTKWTFLKFPDGTFIAECSEVTEDSYETSQEGALYKTPNIVVSPPSFTLSVLSVYQNCTFAGAYSWGAAWIGQVSPEPKINYTVFALEKLDNIVDAEKRKIRKYLRITGTWK